MVEQEQRRDDFKKAMAAKTFRPRINMEEEKKEIRNQI
jgi:hypothetical protein